MEGRSEALVWMKQVMGLSLYRIGGILMGNEGEINEECGGFLAWKSKSRCLGVGGELEV